MIISDSILAADPVSTRGSDLGYVIGMPHSGSDSPFPSKLVLVVILHQLPRRKPLRGDCPVMNCNVVFGVFLFVCLF